MAGAQTVTRIDNRLASSLYQPLPHDHFRLLTIHPSHGLKNSILECSLTVKKPEDRPYSALSYCWGDISDTVIVHISGLDFKITRNLEAGLRQLRRESEAFTIWVDAICINQLDDDERSIQVDIMYQIYSYAAEVVVWLGVESEHSNLAIKLINFFGRFLYDTGVESSYFYMYHQEVHDKIAEKETEVWTAAECQGLIIPEAWEAVARLLEKPWWTRLWIVQEIALAKNVKVVCGDMEMLWMDFLALLYFPDALDSTTVLNPLSRESAKSQLQGVTQCISTLIWRENVVAFPKKRLPQFEILSALLQLAPRGCSDARDKVFGTLGMVRSEGIIKADYKQSAVQAYTSCARALAELTEEAESVPELYMRLKILKYAGVGHLDRAIGELSTLPSWVPDWTAFQDERMPKPLSEHWSNRLFLPVKLDFTGSGRTLKTEVFVLDQVKRVEPGSILPWNATTLNDEPAMCPTGNSSRLHAFFRAMMSFDLSGGFTPAEVFYSMAGILYKWFEERCKAVEKETRDASLGELYAARDAPASWGIGSLFPFPLGRNHIQAWDPQFSFEESVQQYCSSSVKQASESTYKKSWFATTEGYLGLGPEGVKEGDLLFVTPGVHCPFLLRGRPEDCVLVGEAYVHGLMEHEAADICRRKGLEQTTLAIR